MPAASRQRGHDPVPDGRAEPQVPVQCEVRPGNWVAGGLEALLRFDDVPDRKRNGGLLPQLRCLERG